MKVKESQIEEKSGKAKKVGEEDVDKFPKSSSDEEDEERRYVRSMIHLSDFGIIISLFDIITIEKDIRYIEKPRARWQYGVTINKGIKESPKNPIVDKSIWFEKENFRDRRFDEIVEKLTENGFKVIDT